MCKRCGGLMVMERLWSTAGEALGLGPPATRCLNCGNLEDPVIRQHRLDRPPARRPVPAHDRISPILCPTVLQQS